MMTYQSNYAEHAVNVLLADDLLIVEEERNFIHLIIFTAHNSGSDDEDIKNGTASTYIDTYIIYGLMSVLLASLLVILFAAIVARCLKKKAKEPQMRTTSTSNTGSTRAHSWVVLCHGDQESGPAATESTCDEVIDCEAGPSQADAAEAPRVVACSRRLESRRPSLGTFLAATASGTNDGGIAGNVAKKETPL